MIATLWQLELEKHVDFVAIADRWHLLILMVGVAFTYNWPIAQAQTGLN